jgi:hypothetical protein
MSVEGRFAMMLHVMYNDGTFDLVNQRLLDMLLAGAQLTGFVRAGRWVFVGRDPIRATRDPAFRGEERRKS